MSQDDKKSYLILYSDFSKTLRPSGSSFPNDHPKTCHDPALSVRRMDQLDMIVLLVWRKIGFLVKWTGAGAPGDGERLMTESLCGLEDVLGVPERKEQDQRYHPL